MTKENFQNQLEGILNEYKRLKSISEYDDFSGNNIMQEVASIIGKSKAVIARIVGIDSEYYKSVLNFYKDSQLYHDGLRLINIVGIIEALKYDLENGYLFSLRELVHAEIFADFLEKAEYLLKEGYKDSAAIITGSTLENHIKELSKKNSSEVEFINENGIPKPKKTERLNSELAKAKVYNLLIQKQITAWLDLRNKAAHGHYDEYSKQDVELMIAGIRNFMINNPA